MEVALVAALKAGIGEQTFWRLTPYNLNLRLKAIGRQRIESALYIGWFSERFAREQKLQGPSAYVEEFLDQEADPDLQTATAEAELARMALDWGLEIEDIDPPTETGPSDSA